MAKAYFNKCPKAKADPGKGGVYINAAHGTHCNRRQRVPRPRGYGSALRGSGSVGAPIAPPLQWVNDPGWAGEMAGGCQGKRSLSWQTPGRVGAMAGAMDLSTSENFG